VSAGADRGRQAWAALPAAWQRCVDEAWRSWTDGSAGVGAVVLGADGSVLAAGRNRMMGPPDDGVLSGTVIAHAEMNALAVVPIGKAVGATLLTTFEPCLMCASAIVQCGVARVGYAAADPVFDGLHDWFGTLPFTMWRRPEREHLGGPVGAFCHVLHLSWLAFWSPADAPVIEAHRRLAPGHLDVAAAVVAEGHLVAVAERGGSAADAIDALWPHLDALGG
jgi:tRNA(Arg) A34 adenosine deaminase TadA